MYFGEDTLIEKNRHINTVNLFTRVVFKYINMIINNFVVLMFQSFKIFDI